MVGQATNDTLRYRLLEALGALGERPALEERLNQAVLRRRGCNADLSRVEDALGSRILDMDGANRGQGKGRPWLRAVRDVLGFLPFVGHNADDQARLDGARAAVAGADEEVASLRSALARFRHTDRRVDELVQTWNASRGSRLPAEPTLAAIAEAADRLTPRVYQLDEAFEGAARGQWAASSAGARLYEAEELAREELWGDEFGSTREQKDRLLREASADLAEASISLGRAAGGSSAGTLSQQAASVAHAAETAFGLFPDTQPIEAARALAGGAVDESRTVLENIGREITRTRAELQRLRAQRDARIRSLSEQIANRA